MPKGKGYPGKSSKVPAGHHKMPDGTIMSDKAMRQMHKPSKGGKKGKGR